MIHIGVGSGSRRLVEIVSMANESGFHIDDVSVSKPSLGDVFLKFTGRQFRD
jgi:ABC-2 type transport system ATP-binding protein